MPPPPPPVQQQTPELNCGRSQAGLSGVVRPAQVADQLFAVYQEGEEFVARVYGELVGSFVTEDGAMVAAIRRHSECMGERRLASVVGFR